MNASALGRLLWRPFSLWNVVVSGGLAVVAALTTAFLRGALDGGSASARQAHLADFVHLSLASVVVPMAAGVVAGWAVFEFLLCPVAASIPGVGRRLQRDLAWAGLLASGLTSLLVAAEFGGSSIPLFLASGLCWFGMGVLWMDPLAASWRLGRWRVWPLVIAPIAASPEIVTFLRTWPLVGATLALLLGVWVFSVPFRRAAMRRRVAEPASVDHYAYRRHGVSRETRTRVSWNPGHPLAGARDWTRAALYETFGTVPGGLLAGLVRGGMMLMSLLVFVTFLLALTSKKPGGTAAETVLNLLWSGKSRNHGTMLMLPTFCALLWVQSPFTLSGTSAYPVSRGLRAEVAWRSSLIQSVGLMVPMALWTALVCELLLRFSEIARPAGLPFYLRAMIALTLLAPLPQAFHLRFLGPRAKGKWSSPHWLGLASFALGLPAVAVTVLWHMAATRTSAVWELALALLAFVSIQSAWRRRIERHFRTQDLVS